MASRSGRRQCHAYLLTYAHIVSVKRAKQVIYDVKIRECLAAKAGSIRCQTPRHPKNSPRERAFAHRPEDKDSRVQPESTV